MLDDVFQIFGGFAFFVMVILCTVAGIRFTIRKLADLGCTCCANVRRDRKTGVAYILERGQRPVSWFGECDNCTKCKRHQPPEPDENRYVTAEESTPFR